MTSDADFGCGAFWTAATLALSSWMSFAETIYPNTLIWGDLMRKSVSGTSGSDHWFPVSWGAFQAVWDDSLCLAPQPNVIGNVRTCRYMPLISSWVISWKCSLEGDSPRTDEALESMRTVVRREKRCNVSWFFGQCDLKKSSRVIYLGDNFRSFQLLWGSLTLRLMRAVLGPVYIGMAINVDDQGMRR